MHVPQEAEVDSGLHGKGKSKGKRQKANGKSTAEEVSHLAK
jgi:hypothetical protein